MATERILHPQWRDEKELTQYPFADGATLTNNENLFLPQNTFIDAAFYPIGGVQQLYLTHVIVTYQTVTLVLGDDNTDQLASGSFPLLQPTDNIRFLDRYGRPAGLLISSAALLAVFQSWPVGDHVFAAAASGFAATCCMPTPEIGVRGFVLADGTLFTGDIWLVGANGIVLSADHGSTNRPGALGGPQHYRLIRVDVVGDPLYKRGLCSTTFATPQFLQQITVQDGCRQVVCLPDQYGDFKITVGHQDAVDTILRIRATPQGLVVETVGEKLQSIK